MSRASTIAIVLLLAASAWTPRAFAAPPAITACRTADGASVYTDKPCRTIGAQSMPMRSELMNRIVQEQTHEANVSGVEVSFLPSMDDASKSDAREAIGRRAAAGGCARSPRQLAMDLRGAFALGDVNRIAESLHWVGMSQRSANAAMQRLARLAKRPLLDAQYYDAWIASAGDDAGAAAGVMQLRFGGRDMVATQDFDVARYRGCWFVRF